MFDRPAADSFGLIAGSRVNGAGARLDGRHAGALMRYMTLLAHFFLADIAHSRPHRAIVGDSWSPRLTFLMTLMSPRCNGFINFAIIVRDARVAFCPASLPPRVGSASLGGLLPPMLLRRAIASHCRITRRT